MTASKRPTAVCLYCGLRGTAAGLPNHIEHQHQHQIRRLPPNPKPPPVTAACPVCRVVGTLAGLTGHVRERHSDVTIPEFQRVTVVQDERWEIRAGDHLPYALVSTQVGNPVGRPWWWMVKPAAEGNRQGRRSMDSGTADTVPDAKAVALARWLSMMPYPQKRSG